MAGENRITGDRTPGVENNESSATYLSYTVGLALAMALQPAYAQTADVPQPSPLHGTPAVDNDGGESRSPEPRQQAGRRVDGRSAVTDKLENRIDHESDQPIPAGGRVARSAVRGVSAIERRQVLRGADRRVSVYLGSSATGKQVGLDQDAIAGMAIEKCREGNPSTGIPILEGKLRDAKIELPSRG